jgi:hypothetical protein
MAERILVYFLFTIISKVQISNKIYATLLKNCILLITLFSIPIVVHITCVADLDDLEGSGSEFSNRPDLDPHPDPTIYNLLQIFSSKKCSTH